MRNKLRLFATFALALTHTLFSPEITHAQGTAFTYQGQLQSGSAPATGLYDLSFALHGTSDPSSPQIGSTVTSLGVGVTNGIFTTMLDFGPVFNGNPVWLSIAVRTNGGGAFTALTPLQSITPSPYAVYAPTAGSVTGPISLTQLPASVLTNGGSNVTLSGVFSGNGTLLSNVTATGLTINPLATNYGTSIPLGTNSWSSNGIYTFTIPAGVLQMTAKLWGGGGSASYSTRGGGGAFSQVTLSVTPGQTYVLVVGQSGGAGGGAGANDASGSVGNTTGGQGSSLFYFDGFNYFTRAVAGGGGGGGGGYGANAGQASGAGNGYATSALTTGVTNLNQIGGNGAPPLDGGNGGGYGGGVSAGDQQANGGGSYGSITYSGAYEIPGNTSDPNYLPGAGFGGALPHGSGADGLGVVLFYGHGPVATLAEGIQAQQFIGDGSLLTNLTATFLTTNAALFSKTPYVGVLTNFYTTAGLQTFTVPAGITNMVAQLWGAGGGNAVFDITVGGGGAFAQVNLNVSPGDTYALVVGQSGGAGGGAGANNASGGAAGANTGSGGQGTSLFKFTGTNYILVALAGGGGGGGILYDGGPGQASGSGSGYSTNALTTGETSLNLFGGDGTAGGINAGGGGGGGYGGGMGGADIFQVATGGGSYGTITFSGNGTAAANTSDLSYVAPNGNSGQDGLAAISFIGHSPGVFLPDTVFAIAFSGDGSQLCNLNLVGDGSKLTNLNLAVDGSKLTNLTLVGDGSHLTNIKLVGNGSQLTNLNLVGDGSKLTNLNFSGFSSTLPSNTLGTNGSYTPIIGDGTHSFTTSSSKGYFAKFGNQVYFEAWVLWSSKGSAAGPLVVSLPFTNASQRPCFSMGFMAGVVGTNGTCFIPNAVAGATNVSIYTYNISTGASSPVPISACAASGELQISGTYRWQ